jgi:hypothetical protein
MLFSYIAAGVFSVFWDESLMSPLPCGLFSKWLSDADSLKHRTHTSRLNGVIAIYLIGFFAIHLSGFLFVATGVLHFLLGIPQTLTLMATSGGVR